MQKLLVLLFISLSLVALPAYADDHGRGRRDYGNHGSYERHHNNGSAWAGVAVIGAIAGLALLAEHNAPAYAVPVYAEPVYQAPVNYARPQPASSVWYYCQSSAMYYPYTKACPDGWQAVPAEMY